MTRVSVGIPNQTLKELAPKKTKKKYFYLKDEGKLYRITPMNDSRMYPNHSHHENYNQN